MSSINYYRELGPEDYLNAERKARAANKAGNTAQNNIPIHGLLGSDSEVTVTTLAQVDADIKEATTSATAMARATLSSWTAGTFTWALKSDGSDQSAPIKWGFFDWG